MRQGRLEHAMAFAGIFGGFAPVVNALFIHAQNFFWRSRGP
jgi:hypothetical protein